MVKEQTFEKTEEYSKCGHVDVLVQAGFLQIGQMLIFNTGALYPAVVIYAVKDTKTGRLSVTTQWIGVKHCPICGESLKDLSILNPKKEEAHSSTG